LVRATLWSDYLCPWCYLGQHRDALLEELGVSVSHLPYELHPDIPPEGRNVRPGGRLAATFARVAEECAEVGLEFRPPTRVPNTRRALETAEFVRRTYPERFASVHRALFERQFVAGDPLDDPAVLDEVVQQAGTPADEVRQAVESGRAAPWLAESMAAAAEAGVTAAPSWLLGESMVVPGVFDPATFRRWVVRMIERDAPAPGR
jgi:predicted DsbA family dithiol-disulfide isomerase